MKSARRFFAILWLALALAAPFETLAQYKEFPEEDPYEDPEPSFNPYYSYETVAYAGGDYFAPSAISSTQTLDIAILGDGFTLSEMPQYRVIAQRLVEGILAQQPFKEYQRFINFHRIDVVSNESGTDYGSDPRCNKLDPYSPYCSRDTALDGGFTFIDQRTLRVNTNKVATVLANSLGAPNSSRYDTAIVLINDPKYGGSDGVIAALSSLHPDYVNGTLHELGHTFTRQADEYGGDVPCYFFGEFQEPNVTARPLFFQPQNDPLRNYKWNYWITFGTPIPTLGTQYQAGVWEGAVGCKEGAWRAHYDSKMRSINRPYGVVNTEVFVKRFYTFAPLVVFSSPAAGSTVSVQRGLPQQFSVSPLTSPLSHGYTVRWRVDRALDGEGMFYTLNTDDLSVGTHTVTATVADETPWVQRDPDGLLSEELTWTVNVTGTTPAPNPLDDPTFFVRQQYRDFLNREAEQSGLDAWVRTLTQCAPGDISCDRVAVSSSFFRSAEFMQNGYLVYRFYKVGLGRPPNFSEFMGDMQPVIPIDGKVEARRAYYADGFTARPSFSAAHDWQGNWDYVNSLMANAGVMLPSRDQLVSDLNNGWKTRADVLRAVAESQEVFDREYNSAFVTMEYFGYLRRDPESGGYSAWLNYLNEHPGDYRTMVNGFVNSWEYRHRFGLP
ncbi:MAG TPA: M64 family metallopeptidase [Pyrinomonadaceae bacterium]|jgi:hypothetical protein